MPYVDVQDDGGHVLQMEFRHGMFFMRPPNRDDALQHHLDLVRNLDLRDDDVLICAYPSCGTHWVWEMTQMLKLGAAKYDARAKEAMMIDVMPEHVLQSLPSPRTLNSHFLFRFLPKTLEQCKTKIVSLNRDPRDVAVSWYNHLRGLANHNAYHGPFAHFLPLFLHGTVPYGSWFDYTKDWDKVLGDNPQLQVLTLFYEDIKECPAGAVRQLADFLELDAADQLCSDIAEACDFRHLKEASSAGKVDPLQHTWKDGHAGVYRKGQPGDWKNWFTVAQAELFEDFFNTSMEPSSVFSRYQGHL